MLFALIAAAVLAAWWHTHRVTKVTTGLLDRLDRQQAQHALYVSRLVATKNPDLEQLVGLVDRLCQRVQAPAQAVIDHSLGTAPPSPPAVGFEDDEAYHAARSLTTDELAEAFLTAERAEAANGVG